MTPGTSTPAAQDSTVTGSEAEPAITLDAPFSETEPAVTGVAPLTETEPALLDEAVVATPPPASNPTIVDGREYLNPELARDPFHLEPGRREYRHRLSFSPCAGRLGDRPLYAIRLAYCPNSWLGWEAALGHNPGESVHAVNHSISGHFRYPLPGRIQPYATLGYGMALVYPGEALNADPVTSNILYAGGGCEMFIRGDLALRVELRSATLLDAASAGDESIAYEYGEATAGLSFYRGLSQ
jgi:hypothetical protein